jgi:DNA-binding NarL/FixJ family response regulator
MHSQDAHGVPLEQIRVAVVDEDAFVRCALVDFFCDTEDICCAGHFPMDEYAVERVTALAPIDVVITDARLPDFSLKIATDVLVRRPEARVVMWSSSALDSVAKRAISAGVTGFLLKTCGLPALAAALRAVHLGFVVVAAEVTSPLRGTMEVTPPHLSTREQEVLQLVCEGQSNPDIARTLGISPSSVKTHVSTLMRKFGSDNRVGLVAKTFRE